MNKICLCFSRRRQMFKEINVYVYLSSPTFSKYFTLMYRVTDVSRESYLARYCNPLKCGIAVSGQLEVPIQLSNQGLACCYLGNGFLKIVGQTLF
jgi:hypothetical protein